MNTLVLDPVAAAAVAAGLTGLVGFAAEPCSWCNGRGKSLSIDDLGIHECSICQGSRTARVDRMSGTMTIAAMDMNLAELRWGKIEYDGWLIGPHRSWREWRIGHPDTPGSYPILSGVRYGTAHVHISPNSALTLLNGSYGTWERDGWSALIRSYTPTEPQPWPDAPSAPGLIVERTTP